MYKVILNQTQVLVLVRGKVRISYLLGRELGGFEYGLIETVDFCVK